MNIGGAVRKRGVNLKFTWFTLRFYWDSGYARNEDLVVIKL